MERVATKAEALTEIGSLVDEAIADADARLDTGKANVDSVECAIAAARLADLYRVRAKLDDLATEEE